MFGARMFCGSGDVNKLGSCSCRVRIAETIHQYSVCNIRYDNGALLPSFSVRSSGDLLSSNPSKASEWVAALDERTTR